MRHQWKLYVGAVGLVLVALAVCPSRASAATLFVECEDTPPVLTYATIQAAVNAADSGDTVKVCEGKYTENVTVSKNGLRLVAEDEVKLRCPGTGPLASRGSGFRLFASATEIKGFEISRCDSGITVEIGAPTAPNNREIYGSELITKNSLHHNNTGITINRSRGNNSVVENEIFWNKLNGIFDFDPEGDFFFENEITKNGRNGIEISSTDVSNLFEFICGLVSNGFPSCFAISAVIVHNEITDNASPSTDVGVGNGIYLNHADNVDVKWNKLLENRRDGLYSNASMNGLIFANDANENGRDGMEFSSAATGNKVKYNRMEKNGNFDADDHTNPPPNGQNTWTGNDCTKSGGLSNLCSS